MAKSTLSDYHRDRVEEVRSGLTTHLDLSSAGLKSVPEEVLTLPKLEALDLGDNDIREVPARIQELAKLRKLNLGGNPIRSVPDIPGLHLDWDAYLACEPVLSPAHVVGLNVPFTIRESGRLVSTMTELPGLRDLLLGFTLAHARPKARRLSSPSAIPPESAGCHW